MDNDSKNDEKHTWAALVAIALFSNSFVPFPPDDLTRISPPRLQYALPSSFSFFLFLNLPIQRQSFPFQIPLQKPSKESPTFLKLQW